MISASSFYLSLKTKLNENPTKFQLREEDLATCIESCIQDPFCLGYGHVSPVDCILIISNLGGDFTISDEDINGDDIAVTDPLSDNYL